MRYFPALFGRPRPTVYAWLALRSSFNNTVDGTFLYRFVARRVFQRGGPEGRRPDLARVRVRRAQKPDGTGRGRPVDVRRAAVRHHQPLVPDDAGRRPSAVLVREKLPTVDRRRRGRPSGRRFGRSDDAVARRARARRRPAAGVAAGRVAPASSFVEFLSRVRLRVTSYTYEYRMRLSLFFFLFIRRVVRCGLTGFFGAAREISLKTARQLVVTNVPFIFLA